MNSRKHWLFAALVALCAGTDATAETLINNDVLLLAAGFLLLFYTFPAGMVLYWTSNNLISTTKSLWARR
jgi:hypothetical protein